MYQVYIDNSSGAACYINPPCKIRTYFTYTSLNIYQSNYNVLSYVYKEKKQKRQMFCIVFTLFTEYMIVIKLFIVIRRVCLDLCHFYYFIFCSTGTFDLHIYTNQGCEVPEKWDETQPCFVANAQELSLRTFSTSLHKVGTRVIYKVE